jgi:hypothetical protein
LKFLSSNNNVNPPANTGSDNISSTAVTRIVQLNKPILPQSPSFIFFIVVIKFIAPNIEDIPATCNDSINKSTDPSEWLSIDDKG